MCQVEYLAETKGTEIKRATIPPRSARLGISKETEITPKIVGVGKGRRRVSRFSDISFELHVACQL